MKNVKYRQTTMFGCGSFSLANIFDDHRFVVELPTQGERPVDLARKLNKYQRRVYLYDIFRTNQHLLAGNCLMQCQSEIFGYGDAAPDPDACRPLVLTFARPNGNLHSVAAVHRVLDDHFYVVDSCVPWVARFTVAGLIAYFKIVAIQQFGLHSCQDPANLLLMPSANFSHIFD